MQPAFCDCDFSGAGAVLSTSEFDAADETEQAASNATVAKNMRLIIRCPIVYCCRCREVFSSAFAPLLNFDAQDQIRPSIDLAFPLPGEQCVQKTHEPIML